MASKAEFRRSAHHDISDGGNDGWSLIPYVVAFQTILGLCLVTGLFISFASWAVGSTAGFEDRTSGTPLLQVAGLVVYLPALVFLVSRLKQPIETLRRSCVLIFLQTLILLSCLWAVDAGASIRRSAALTLEVIFILHIASWYSPHKFLRLMAWTLGTMLVISILSVVVPGIGITPSGTHSGSFRGIFPSKNVFGEFAAITIFTFIVMAISSKRNGGRPALWNIFALIGLVALYLSNSRTPLLALIGAVGFIGCAAFIAIPAGWQSRIATSIRVLIVGIIGLISVVILPTVALLVISALGRDMTLSGRTKLWEYAIEKGWDRPWFGAGYKSFWNDKLTFDLRALHEHWNEGYSAKALTANAHNGYIDVWLELGFFGLAIFIVSLIWIAFRSGSLLRRTKDPIYLWHFGVLGFALVYYITESGVLGYNEFTWFAIIYALLSIGAQQIRVENSGEEIGQRSRRGNAATR